MPLKPCRQPQNICREKNITAPPSLHPLNWRETFLIAFNVAANREELCKGQREGGKELYRVVVGSWWHCWSWGGSDFAADSFCAFPTVIHWHFHQKPPTPPSTHSFTTLIIIIIVMLISCSRFAHILFALQLFANITSLVRGLLLLLLPLWRLLLHFVLRKVFSPKNFWFPIVICVYVTWYPVHNNRSVVHSLSINYSPGVT